MYFINFIADSPLAVEILGKNFEHNINPFLTL